MRDIFALIRRVAAEANMPVLKHYQGNCHVYVDTAADLGMAEAQFDVEFQSSVSAESTPADQSRIENQKSKIENSDFSLPPNHPARPPVNKTPPQIRPPPASITAFRHAENASVLSVLSSATAP